MSWISRLFKRKAPPFRPALVPMAEILERQHNKAMQELEDRAFERDVETLARERLRQYIANPQGLVIDRPIRFMYVEHDAAWAKYKPSDYPKMIRKRFNELQREYLEAKHAGL